MDLKGPECSCSPLRTYAVVVGMLVVAALLIAGVKLSVGASSSSSPSGLVIVNSTLVDTTPWYRYLYPWATSINVLLLVLNFLLSCL